jgi:hypothetical protein
MVMRSESYIQAQYKALGQGIVIIFISRVQGAVVAAYIRIETHIPGEEERIGGIDVNPGGVELKLAGNRFGKQIT